LKTTTLSGGLACRIEGSGPPLALFHGGGGSWSHWIRNIPQLAVHYTVHALDLPGFGDSSSVSAEITDDDYVDLVCDAVREIAAGGSIYLAGFSFGAVNAVLVTTKMPATITKLALLAPGGLGRVSNAGERFRKMPPDSAPEDEKRAVLRHNLLVMMLAHPQSIDETTVDIQRDNVAHFRHRILRQRHDERTHRHPDPQHRRSAGRIRRPLAGHPARRAPEIQTAQGLH
jgi:pimeloyl-ACP methyl ester carboxylesterase